MALAPKNTRPLSAGSISPPGVEPASGLGSIPATSSAELAPAPAQGGRDTWAGLSGIVTWFESAVAPYLGTDLAGLKTAQPSATPDYAGLASMAHPPNTAVVQIGDSLQKIAQRYLGDASLWLEIYALNRDQILTPYVILPGMILKLPAKGPAGYIPPPPGTWPVPPGLLNPPRPASPVNLSSDPTQLATVTPEQLAWLGANNKAEFFAVLKPAAVAAQQKYGVPWQVTLAQAALESGWGQHAIGGYNIFGIKGRGPAGSVNLPTDEWQGGHWVSVRADFAKYDNFYQAIEEHGALFHNGYYNKAIDQFARDDDPVAFVENIQGIYATSPSYADSLLLIMRQFHLS